MLLQSVGIKPVIVHGGGPAVTQLSARLGIETTFVDGLRVTDAETLDVATMVLAGKLNTDVVSSLVTGGVNAVGLSGVDGRLLLARQQEAPDLGFVGEVVHVDGGLLVTLLDRSFVPVVASIAVDEHGQAYNVNADVVAAELAVELERREARVHQRRPGIDRDDGRLAVRTLGDAGERPARRPGRDRRRDDPEGRERGARARGRRRPDPLRGGRVEHAVVLELFTPEGIGTMITPELDRSTP